MSKKVLIVIAPENFRDEEFFEPKEILEKANIEVDVANSTGAVSKSSFGKMVIPDKSLDEVNANDYDAVIFVGGSGSSVYFNNKKAIGISKEFFDKGKIVAAICIAPTILANAGILNGKKATAYPSEKDRINAVGTYTGSDIEQDGNVITGKWPSAAKEFGRKIVKALK